MNPRKIGNHYLLIPAILLKIELTGRSGVLFSKDMKEPLPLFTTITLKHCTMYGCQLTRDTGVVEDLLQDFFVALRLGRQKTSKVSCIKAYLMKSFRRKIIRHLKKKKILVFNEGFTEGNFKISFHHDMQFIKTQFHQEQQKHIAQMLNKLTQREREAVYYFYFENLDYKSISQVMGLSSAKSARNLIYKARRN